MCSFPCANDEIPYRTVYAHELRNTLMIRASGPLLIWGTLRNLGSKLVPSGELYIEVYLVENVSSTMVAVAHGLCHGKVSKVLFRFGDSFSN